MEKLTKTQSNVMIDILNDVRRDADINEITFEEYADRHYTQNGLNLKAFEEQARWSYELAKAGKCWGFYNTNTLKALERKGYIRIEEVGGMCHDVIVPLVKSL